jgi:hypothetical protein
MPTITEGQTVTYHGSLTDQHGPAVVIDRCDCDECWDLSLVRWVLFPGPVVRSGQHRVLSHVRPESFTI